MATISNIILTAIRLYQKAVSPYLGLRCRYIPSCSYYMLEAIQTQGIRKGLMLGLKRIIRCHPFGGHGYDPVPHSHVQGR